MVIKACLEHKYSCIYTSLTFILCNCNKNVSVSVIATKTKTSESYLRRDSESKNHKFLFAMITSAPFPEITTRILPITFVDRSLGHDSECIGKLLTFDNETSLRRADRESQRPRSISAESTTKCPQTWHLQLNTYPKLIMFNFCHPLLTTTEQCTLHQCYSYAITPFHFVSQIPAVFTGCFQLNRWICFASFSLHLWIDKKCIAGSI